MRPRGRAVAAALALVAVIAVETTSLAAPGWTTSRDGSVEIDHPSGWRLQRDDASGQLVVQGTRNERLIVWPFFVGGGLDEASAGRVLARLARGQAPQVPWAPPQSVGRGALRTGGRGTSETAVASLVWTTSPRGTAAQFVLAVAPGDRGRDVEPVFAKILASLRLTGRPPTAGAASAPRIDVAYVRFQDPSEGAFSLDVPRGWRVSGGLVRKAPVDVRSQVVASSPDNHVHLRIGDADVPPFTLPTPLLVQSGFREGATYSPGYGVNMLVMRYLPGEQFAQSWVTSKVGPTCAGLQIVNTRPLPRTVEAMNAIMARHGSPAVSQRLHAGDLAFRCQRGEVPMVGYLFVATLLTAGSAGGGTWHVDQLQGYLSPPARAGEAQAVLSHMAETVTLNPEWVRMQQNITASTSRIVADTGAHISRVISDSYWTRQASLDEVSRRRSNQTMGLEDVRDPVTGRELKVENSSTYHWIDHRGNIVGTDVYNRPSLDFRELVKQPGPLSRAAARRHPRVGGVTDGLGRPRRSVRQVADRACLRRLASRVQHTRALPPGRPMRSLRAATVLVFLLPFLGVVSSSFPGPHPASAYSVVDGRIVGAQGQLVQLRGVNWSGFETNDHVVHGLWARNWKSMVDQMRELGFNAVRLPLCPGTLRGSAPSSIDYGRNPDLAGLDSLELLDVVVHHLDAQGLYVLLDHHRPDCESISELWYTPQYSEQEWIADLTLLAARYGSVARVIGVDPKNEPHGAATWGTGHAATDWNGAAERAAAAVGQLAPHWLIFVEGIQQNPTCSASDASFWGENLEPLTCTPLAIPADRLVLSPHTYGPDVFGQPYFDDPAFPANMPAIWHRRFGQFIGAGHAVVLGEFGGKYGTGDPRDVSWQDALVDYLASQGVSSGFYWTWNPNSGDTGGILNDDWNTVREDKLTLLRRLWAGTATPPFADVPAGHPYFTWISALVRARITAGCATAPPRYCPDDAVSRAQMAVFLLRAILGADYQPPDATGAFADVPATNAFARWIEELARQGITGGCAVTPARYCPDAPVTRAQMAVFLLRARDGSFSTPPAPVGTFADVPATHPQAAWIEELARQGITGGCATTPRLYCPDAPVTRAQMAVFLARTFGLPL